MRRISLALALLGLLGATNGCAMCQNPYDCFYNAYGGRRERDDMTHGRVGSAFAPASAQMAAYENQRDDVPPPVLPDPYDDSDPSIESQP